MRLTRSPAFPLDPCVTYWGWQGVRASNTVEVRPLGLTPWPLS
jgi:hypothetical protein